MAIKNQALTVHYFAWNSSTGAGQTGDVANHAIRGVGDGTIYTPAAGPAEVDATNFPGLYKVALTAGEANYNFFSVGGKSSTANVQIIPVHVTTERGVLPGSAAAGASGGLHINGSNAGTTTYAALTVTGATTLTGGLVGNITGNLIGTVSTLTTYTGNTPQTGDAYARIGAAGAGLTALGDTRIANLDAAITSRLAPTVAGRTLDVSATGEAGLDWANIGSPTTTVALSGTTVGTVTTYTGNTVQTGDAYARIGAAGAGLTALGDTRIANLDLTVSSRASQTSVDTLDDYVDTEVDAIKAVTDQLATALEADGAGGYQWTTLALENAPAGGGGGTTDWTATERSQIRFRLGLDGATATPTATPTLSVTVSDKTGFALSATQTFSNTGTWTGNIVGTVSTLTTYTGNTPQTGDAYARIGANGAGLTALVPPTAAAVANAVMTDTTPADLGTAGSLGILMTELLTMLQADGLGGFQFKVTALENAPAGTGGGGSGDWTTPELDQIRYRLGIDGAVATPTATPNLPVTVSDKTGFALSAAGLDAVVVESGTNARQALSYIAAAAAGVDSGAGTTQFVFKGVGVATTRFTASVSNGNRTSIALVAP